MLIGKSCDAQFICLRPTGSACPIDLHRDVRVTNLLKGRIQVSMAGANLNSSLKFIARMPVINGDHIPSQQICGDAVHPIERGLIKRRAWEWTLDEQKLVALKVDKLFDAGPDQADWHRVQQFV